MLSIHNYTCIIIKLVVYLLINCFSLPLTVVVSGRFNEFYTLLQVCKAYGLLITKLFNMAKRNISRTKDCHCHTCNKDFHYLGINMHRAMHRKKKEDCRITYTYGDTYSFKYSEG